MRYDLESMLPINAFSPRGGRGVFARGMTLEGGGKGGGGGGGSAPAPDPNIGIAQRKMADIAEEYLKNWKAEVWPALKETTLKQDARADEQFAIDKEIQKMQISAAKKGMAEYNRNAVNREAIYQEAETYNTEANKERIAAEAIGDTKNAFAVNEADQMRQMQAYGINPTSGRSVGAMNVNKIMQAATEASAATKARNAAEQLGWAKKMDAVALSQGAFSNQATSTGLALNAGNQALNAGQTSMANYGAMGQSMGGAYGQASQGWGNIGNMGVQMYGIQSQNYQSEQNRQAQAAAGNAAGMGSAIGGLAMAGAYAF